jgi:hypothetical protein
MSFNSGGSMMAETDIGMQVRPYSKPTLTVYGKVQDLTKANFTSGSPDGGADPRQRTSVQ